jgi:Flp pilus assembly protein TadG
VAGDTTLRQLSVGPNNSTTSPNEGLEYTVNPVFGTLNYVAGSASLGGTNNSELTFTVNNSGSTIMEIDQISVGWSNSSCWECDYAYLANITVNGTDYWRWNTTNRNALASTDARLVLDQKLSLSSGNTTIGPLAFQDLVDGTGSPQPMNAVTFQITFLSDLTPNQIVSFSTGGTCSPAVISYSNLSKPLNYRVRCQLDNTGNAKATITGMNIKCDVSPSPYLDVISFVDLTNIYWQANQSWCGNQSRQLVDNLNGAEITFCKTQPPVTVPGGSYILLNRMDFYTSAQADDNTKADVTGGNFTLTLHFKCGSDQTISFTMP